MNAREELVEHFVELREMAEVEAAQEAPERRRIGQAVAAQALLRSVRAREPCVVEAIAAGDQRLADRKRRLSGRVTAPTALDGDPVEQLVDAEPRCELADQHEAGVSGDLLRRALDLDALRCCCYLHPQRCPPFAPWDVSQRPC